MKKILTYSFLICSLLFFNSCENESLEGFDLSDPALSEETESGNNSVDFANLPNGGVSEGDYYPAKLNNRWVYNNAVSVEQKIETEVVGDFTDPFGNNVFEYSQSQPVKNDNGIEISPNIYFFKKGGNYFTYTDEIEVDYGGGLKGTLSPMPLSIVLKDNVDVGTNWNVSYDQTNSFNNPAIPDFVIKIDFNYEIVGKNLTKTVNGIAYSPVIEVEVTSILSGQVSDEVFNYFYALDIGLIKIEQNGQCSLALESYTLN